MKVKSLRIRNFKAIQDLKIMPHDKINVIVGVNGAGKSTVLQTLNHLFSWFTARMKNANGKGTDIARQDINRDEDESLLEIELDNGVYWSLYKQKSSNRQKPIAKTDLKYMTNYTNELVKTFSADPAHVPLPLIASYGVNRAVIDIPIRLKKKHELEPMSIYDIPLVNGVNFRSFFEWFREREDIENERMRFEKKEEPDKQLQAVRNAISSILPGYGELRVQRNPRAFVLNKNGVLFKIDQLSDGEKCYLTLIADIARRLATANPLLENPLAGEGVILIDEIDLHLHPSWQMEVIPKIRSTFPNCQFFLTTHSPYIVSDIRNFDHEQLLLLENGAKILSSLSPFGKTVDSILTDFFQMETVRNKEVQGYLNRAWDLLGNKAYHTKEFEAAVQWLESHLGASDIEIGRIKAEKNKRMKLDNETN